MDGTILKICLVVGTVIIFVCLWVIIKEIWEYAQRMKKYKEQQKINKRELSIIEKLIPSIQLHNEGKSVDEMIAYIMDDEDIETCMRWREEKS